MTNPPRATPRKLRVLVAEDDPDYRALVASELRRDGHSVLEIEDGDHLAEFTATALFTGYHMPHAIVADVRMPGQSGLAVARALRRASATIPIILMTAFGDAETHAAARELGAVALLDKPFEMSVLRNLLQQNGRAPTA